MTDPTQIIVEQKLSINITKWQQYNDISIQQGSNTIYVSQERLAELIKGLITFSNDRPAPDQDGAEEVLNRIIGECTCDEAYRSRRLTAHDCVRCSYYDDIIKAMTTHARNEVAKAVKAKDEEIDRLNDSMTQLLRLLSEAVRPEVRLPRRSIYILHNECLNKIKRLNPNVNFVESK